MGIPIRFRGPFIEHRPTASIVFGTFCANKNSQYCTIAHYFWTEWLHKFVCVRARKMEIQRPMRSIRAIEKNLNKTKQKQNNGKRIKNMLERTNRLPSKSIWAYHNSQMAKEQYHMAVCVVLANAINTFDRHNMYCY